MLFLSVLHHYFANGLQSEKELLLLQHKYFVFKFDLVVSKFFLMLFIVVYVFLRMQGHRLLKISKFLLILHS